MRPYFDDPAELLFRGIGMTSNLTPAEMAQWEVTLDWPIRADTLLICVTKRKAMQPESESQVEEGEADAQA